jgi:hypothetical protein
LTPDESLLETCDVIEDDEDDDIIKANNIDDKEIPVPSFRVVNGDISGLRSKAQEVCKFFLILAFIITSNDSKVIL